MGWHSAVFIAKLPAFFIIYGGIVNILIFEYKNFGIADVKECFSKAGYKYKIIETEKICNRLEKELDELFMELYEDGIDNEKYDCVFTFNFSPVISNNCKKYGLPYISWVYDSPQVLLYSYTIINPCNYVFLFDKAQYIELKNVGINTVYYAPLAVNMDRMKSMLEKNVKLGHDSIYKADIAFVGSMYNEKHNLYDRLNGVSDYTKGYLESIMKAQREVYGYFFLEHMLNDRIINDMKKACPLDTSKDGVETIEYLYANYFLARKMAADERHEIIEKIGKRFSKEYIINLYTPNATPDIQGVYNKGPVDYYDEMPYVFNNSRINLNITLRSIKSGIPLRCMDICAAGGFLLSNYQEDMYDVFVPGEDMVMYESVDDLVNKCRYYLEHESERRQIASNGTGKVSEKHTYDIRFKEIFDIVFN